MCIIIAKPSNVALPKEEWILNSESNNNDGIGIALKKVSARRVLIKKDFKDGKELIEWMNKSVAVEDDFIIHFRWATSGKKDEGNRHPFPITLNKKLLRKTVVSCKRAVTHNGVLTQYSGHAKYSDTQKFTVDILATPIVRENLFDPTVQHLIKEYISGDKLAILDYEKGMLLIGEFEKDEGCYFSNDGYKRKKYVVTDCSSRSQARHPYYAGYYNGNHHYYDSDGDEYVSDCHPHVSDVPQVDSEDDVIQETCDGCGRLKAVRVVEVEEDNSMMYLCKRCRRVLKKYGLEGLAGQEKRIWKKCDSCNEFHPPENIIDGGNGFEYCKSCTADFVKWTQTQTTEELKGKHEAS